VAALGRGGSSPLQRMTLQSASHFAAIASSQSDAGVADAGNCLRATLGGLHVREMYEASLRRSESACVVVERGESFVKVDFYPLAPGLLRVAHCDADKFSADAPSLMIGTHFRVDEEGVVAAIPRNVHEADERPLTYPRGDPAETVRADPVPPPSLRCSTVRLREHYELVVSGLATPRKPDVSQRSPFAPHRS
jgi:hypothetical protein